MKKKSKLKKFFISIAIILVVVIVVPLFVFTFEIKAQWFSEEQHIVRISNRLNRAIERNDIKGLPYNEDYSYDLFPLYNENEELVAFLVEFYQYGYLYVSIGNGNLWYNSMYYLSSFNVLAHSWVSGIDYSTSVNYIDSIKLHQSPFLVRAKEKERMYFLKVVDESGATGHIPSVKENDKFINLYSNQEFEFIDGMVSEVQVDGASIRFNRKLYKI